MKGNVPSQKKQVYPIQEHLLEYLIKYNRAADLPLQYSDLLRYNTAIPLIDQEGNDTLWETVYYPEYDQKEIYQALKYIYSLLKVDGNVELLDHLTIARIDYCNFGNSKPFRIRIINRINDNYDHFYVKKADASRVYGLELEDILSPNTMIYIVSGSTLIEEHIAGVPGDDFMKRHLQESVFNKTRIAKEFVKFNERCFARLLGDMRSYNYVVDITPDIEGNQYRMRAIDFDQQSYEGRKSFYLPQYFRENNPIIFLGINNMAPESVLQYQLEERSLMAVRMKTQPNRSALFFQTMMADDIAPSDKIQQLREELIYHHKNDIFDKCFTMGQIVVSNINLLTQKYHR